MKQINETWWEVFQIDDIDNRRDVIARFTTQKDAIEYMDYLSTRSLWSTTVEKKTFNLSLFESVQELLDKESMKADLKEQIKRLEEELKALG